MNKPRTSLDAPGSHQEAARDANGDSELLHPALTRSDYARLFLGEFNQEQETPLDDLAREYYKRTEAYDRTVCTGPIEHGSIMPATSEEFRIINRHAIAVHRELRQRAEMQGYSSTQLHQAMRKYAARPDQ